MLEDCEGLVTGRLIMILLIQIKEPFKAYTLETFAGVESEADGKQESQSDPKMAKYGADM